MGSPIAYIANILAQRVFVSNTFFKFEGCRAARGFPSYQHHSTRLSLSFVNRFTLSIDPNHTTQSSTSTAIMRLVAEILSLAICMRNVHALPQGSSNSHSSEVSNPLPTATLPITTLFVSPVLLVQSTLTNALLGTTGVSLHITFSFCMTKLGKLQIDCTMNFKHF